MPCFYQPDFNEKSDEIIILSEEFHHAVHVFRKKCGDEILLSNGTGLLCNAKIVSIEKKRMVAQAIHFEKKIKSKPKIALAFALLKNKNDHLLIEKTTELGIVDFFPFISERSVRKTNENTIEKFQKTIISAGKQCDNAHFPFLSPVLDLAETLDLIRRKEYLPIVAYEEEKSQFLQDILPLKMTQNYCLIIGPEGGFADNEIELFQKNQIPIVSLGNHILRAETAAICGISVFIQKCLENDRNYY
jgi:16S rRNA (uracil1498-N3)-methyltransferase